MKTIVVADDHQVMREGLCALLGTEKDFKIVGQAGDGEAAVRLIEQLHPDVLVLDMVMPGLSGIETAKAVKKLSPSCAIVVLSMYGTDTYVSEAIRAGAKGYVLKKDSARELIKAIQEVLAGRYYIGQSLTQKAIDSYIGIESPRTRLYQTLTPREREILQLVAGANTSAQIAAELHISRRTVEFHRANIMRKLDFQKQQELYRYCLEEGIIPPPHRQ